MTEQLKHCPHCDLDLPRSQFYKNNKSKDGKTVYCKAYYARYYAANRERQAYTTRRAQIKRRYGLTMEQHTALLVGGCVVCGSMKKLHVDHCHSTGNVRGVLCQDCNHAVGNAHDDPERLRKLAAYLESGTVISQGLIGPSY